MQVSGRYLLIETIGTGGMGVVYRAHDPNLDREVAVKVLREQTLAHPEGARQREARLLCEARVLAQLSHPNVVSVFDMGVDQSGAFVAMELVAGMSVREWLYDRPTDREILDAFIGAGRGLAAAHAAGIVHRDFKPGNVLIGDDGRARVIDFGLANAPVETTCEWSGPLDVQDTATGIVWGTPRFMAPEQLRGQVADQYCDQYSFCVALSEALGRVPMALGLTLEELVAERGLLPRKPRAISRAVWKVLRRGLDPDPRQRWPSMTMLVDALVEAADRRTRRVLWGPLMLALAFVVSLSL